jgi:hypothetical protein
MISKQKFESFSVFSLQSEVPVSLMSTLYRCIDINTDKYLATRL